MANDSKMPSDDDTPPPCSSRENSDTTRHTSEYHASTSEFPSLSTPTVSRSRDNEARSTPTSTSENRPTPEDYPSMITSSFGFSPDIQFRGRAPRRHDGVADPQPTPLLTPLTRINSPNSTEASLPNSAHDPKMGAVPALQQMRADPNSSERSELCREHRRTRIYDGVLLPSSQNRSNIPAVMPVDNPEQRPPATPRPSFSLPIKLARQQVHSREIENTGGR
jgi:hypothetical protein